MGTASRTYTGHSCVMRYESIPHANSITRKIDRTYSPTSINAFSKGKVGG